MRVFNRSLAVYYIRQDLNACCIRDLIENDNITVKFLNENISFYTNASTFENKSDIPIPLNLSIPVTPATNRMYNFTKHITIEKDDAVFRNRIINKTQTKAQKDDGNDKHYFSAYPDIDILDFLDDQDTTFDDVEKCPENTYLAAFVHISYTSYPYAKHIK